MTDIAAYVRAAVRRLGPPDRETIARLRAIVRPALPATESGRIYHHHLIAARPVVIYEEQPR